MPEDFLYFIWQYRLFKPADKLLTSTGQILEIHQTGFRNHHSGPDYHNSKIGIDGIIWYGNIEMHVNSSDWEAHQHQLDPSYNNVILHVVWNDDAQVRRSDGTPMPTLVLKDKVENQIFSRYEQLVGALQPVPCISQAHLIDMLKWYSMLDKTAVQRLEKKAEDILITLDKTNGNWEESVYRVLMKYMGFNVNSQPMDQLASQLPFNVLKKNSGKLKAIEALLFGQAGFLKSPQSDYQRSLQIEYNYLSKKYSLAAPLNVHQWRFMRMRPPNFPTLRLAQLAAVFNTGSSIAQVFLHEHVDQLKNLLLKPPSVFWETHYHFNKKVKPYSPSIGDQALELLMINIVAPVRAAYALQMDDYRYMDTALELLHKLSFEKNKITRAFQKIPFNKKSAFDSQAILHLFKEYCSKKKCLSCDIGVGLIKK